MSASADGPTVLVVDDEPGLRDVLKITLERQGFDVVAVNGAKHAVDAINKREVPFPLILTDLVMPDGSGMEVLECARSRSEDTQVIVITAFSTVESAIEAMRLGAYDFVKKPFSPAEIGELAKKALEKSKIVAENRRLRATLESIGKPSGEGLFGDDPSMMKVASLVEKAATTRTTVLITGESGTGKERVARVLHELSQRSGPLCVINCGALPEALMESELFGHEKGAFTGAATSSIGLFRQADGGTLLLDEIGELPLSLQVKLLRVLQERRVRPVGSATEVDVDVRVVAATNRDVEADLKEGTFRTDLYYRLNVIRIELPPLRQRRSDVRKLARRMVKQFADEFDKDTPQLTREALEALERYPFPGNIRELENMMERAVALSSGGDIGLEDLPDDVRGGADSPINIETDLPDNGCDLDRVLEGVERRLLLQSLERTGGVRNKAADLLGISFRSLRYRLSKLGMDPNADQDAGKGAEKDDSGAVD
jgi:two-component system response regulator PilR (NtrC family)